MALRFKSVRGTKDILPEEAEVFRNIESRAQNIFSIYGYREIITPVIEPRDLFIRSLGKDTEIVGKQMFIIERPEEISALRPEATAGVVRAYLENNLDKRDGFVKFYYIGPMFRAERPQKGRLRQFHHIGVEAIGSESAMLDAEVISLADSLLRDLGIADFDIKINSLGCVEDKKTFSGKLRCLLKDKVPLLCPDCQDRYNRNVFRILDCKDKSCRSIVSHLGLERKDYLCDTCFKHFEFVLDILRNTGIKYRETPYLVRGLDYYTRTVFEITHSALGAQDALCAGGRYDNLVEQLGGPPTGAIGFAFGMERLLLVLPSNGQSDPRQGVGAPTKDQRLIYLATLGEAACKQGFKIITMLRSHNIGCSMDYENRSLKSQLRLANNLGATFVLIIGDDELAKGVIILKDMRQGTQEIVKREEILEKIKIRVPSPG